MGISDCWLRRQIVSCIVVLLAVPFGQAATPRPQQTPSGQQAEGGSTASAQPRQAQPQNSANTTGAPTADANKPAGIPDNPNSGQIADSSQQTSASQQGQPQTSTSKALGTAAAPYEKSTGVPASRPAGAVIAPAKQRRTRSFLIKVGVIVGAAVAIGTVVALSKASPNRPN